MTDTKNAKVDELARIEVARVNECSLDDVGEFATDINLFKAGWAARGEMCRLSDEEYGVVSAVRSETNDKSKDTLAFQYLIEIIDRLTSKGV